MKNKTSSVTFVGLLALLVASSGGQVVDKTQNDTGAPPVLKKREDLKFRYPSFTFVRIKYSESGRRRSSWAVDFPDSDRNFSGRFEQETGLQTDRQGKVMQLTDPDLKKYPFIYMVEVGQVQFTAGEVQALRDYLLGGGFLMTDDFWGEAEWQSFYAEIKRVLPEREPVELALDHPVFRTFYDIREKPQVPSIAVALAMKNSGLTWEREDAKTPHYRGILDDRGRLMAIFCHNTDLADGWEREGEDLYYFKEFSVKRAYPMGINIVVYALTH